MNIRNTIKDTLYGQVERLAKGMASAKRLELVELLCQSPKSVETLASEAGISMKLASAHLKELRLAHLVEADRQGRQMIYRIACPEVAQLLVALRMLAKDRLLESQQAIQQLDAVSDYWTVPSAESLCQQSKRGEIFILDVRPFSEYEQRHLPCAHSIPIFELSARMGEIPQQLSIVVCGRGPYCQLATEAIVQLKDAGYRAYKWQQGAADWLAADKASDFPPPEGMIS